MRLSRTFRECAALERRIGDLYDTFARVWKHDERIGSFWRRMADDERVHEAALASAAERAADHDPWYPLDPASIAAIRGYVLAATTPPPAIHLREALARALDLEGLELDGAYAQLFQVAGELAPDAFRDLAAARAAFEEHHAALFDAVERFSEDPALLAEVARRRGGESHRPLAELISNAVARALPNVRRG